MTASTCTELYTRVTDRIIADLEQGVRPWLKPWDSSNAKGRITLPVRHNGTPYRGVNILLLWDETVNKGYATPVWMTWKQANQLHARIRKGEHGSLVDYAYRFTRTETADNGEDVEREIPFLKGYTVFNVEQIEGLPDQYYVKSEYKGDSLPLLETFERFFASTGATVRHGGNMAYYAAGPDLIQLPPPDVFKDAESYAATKAHELTHWTKHGSRLNREFGRKRFGDMAYAREELVAELGAAFLCASLGITPEPREDHAAYLGHWLRVLQEDKRAIFSAAAYAQRAVDYLRGLQTPQAAA
jgi:antirestriction protein ArdC